MTRIVNTALAKNSPSVSDMAAQTPISRGRTLAFSFDRVIQGADVGFRMGGVFLN